jgi:hypothetical protein
MVIDNINFNAAWASSVSVQDFIEHEKHHGLSDDQLAQVHELCRIEVNPETLVGDLTETSD